jgi:CubicO group peptidase (beta-lactamase class C family)
MDVGGEMRAKIIIIGLIALLILVIVGSVFIPRLISQEPDSAQSYWPTKEWDTSTPEEQGVDSGKLAEALQTIKENQISLDSLLLIRNGKVILDAYFYPYDPSIPHKLASVTKSFTTTLIGIAIDQGKIQLDQPMVSFFPNRTITNLDERKQSITVRHLVSNMNGFESGCRSGDEATLDKMRANDDWVQAALDRKVVHDPGTSFCYDSPGMHILSAILQEATGMSEKEFAQKYLFGPLGIKDVYWEPDPQGYSHGWGDLYLKPLDAAKLGYLWLNKGVWNGKQIVSSAWVEDSVKANTYGGMDYYGYGWWVSDDSYYAFGRGGQNIKVMPAINFIVVTTASSFDYDQISLLLAASFIDPDNPLPADPEGAAQLESALAEIAQAPHPWQTGPLPETAHEISNQTYLLEPNGLDVASLRLKFKGEEEATLYLNLDGRDLTWPIGLDGEYRVEPDGRALRGYWPDAQTFVFEIYENGLIRYQLHFSEDSIILETPNNKINGQVENP